RPPREEFLFDSLFIFREKSFVRPTESDVAGWILQNEPPEERDRYLYRVMSHEAATERLVFQNQYKLVFTPSSGGTMDGIGIVRDHMVIVDSDKFHPFSPQLMGRPRVFLI